MTIRRSNINRQSSAKSASRIARLRDKTLRLRDRIKRSTMLSIQRHEARLAWWQRAFRAPMLSGWWLMSSASSLWSAIMSLLGFSRKSGLLPRSTAIKASKKYRQSFARSVLFCEGLESRRLLAYSINTPIMSDDIVNNVEKTAVVVSGTATTETQATVAIQDGTNTVVQTVPVVSGVWTATLNIQSLSDTTEVGQPANLAVLVFQPGNVLNQASTTIEKDTVAPSISLPFDIATDDKINIAESTSLNIAGSTGIEAVGSTVTMQFTSGSFSATRTATVVAGGSGGVFSNSTPVDVSGWGHNATVTVQASVSDPAGNIGTTSRSAVTDFVAPPPPTITAPTAGQAFNAASAANVVVTGTGLAGGAITVTTSPAGSTFTGVADGTGAFSIPINIASLASGPVQINVSNVDDAGNPGTSFVTVDLDATAPTLSISPLGNVLASNVSAFPFSGASDANGQTVTLTFTDGSSSPVITTAVVSAGGVFSGTVDLSSLQNGPINVLATVSDAVGNPASATASTTKDSSPPVLSLVTPISGDGFVNAAEAGSVTINGTGRDLSVGASPVTYTVTGPSSFSATGSVTPGAGTSYSFTLNLSAATSGTYTVDVSQTDSLGNVGSSAPATFTLDLVNPGVPTISSVQVNPTGVFVSLPTGGTTRDNTITFNGTAPSVELPTGSNGTVVLTATNTATSAVQTFSSATTGSGATRNWTITTGALADATYTFSVVLRDVAGNSGNSVVWGTATVDTVAPGVTIVSPASGSILSSTLPGSGSTVSSLSASGTTTGAATAVSLVFIHTASSASVSASATMSGADWSAAGINLSSLPDGTVMLLATSTDAAGNSQTTTAIYTKDTLASTPVVLTPIATDNIVNISEASNLTIQGAGADPGASVTLTLTGGATTTAPVTVTANASGGFVFNSVNLSAFGAVEQNIIATIVSTDAAGNSASTTATFFLDTVAPTINMLSDNWGTTFINAAEQSNLILNGTTTGANNRELVISIDDSGVNAFTTPTIMRTVTTNATTGAFNSGNSPAISVASLLDSTLTVTVSVTDTSGNVASQTLNPVKDTAPPLIIIDPNIAGNDVVSASEAAVPIALTGLATGTGSNISTVDIELKDQNNNTVTVSGVSVFPVTGGPWGTTVSFSSLVDGPIQVKVSGTDAAGNSGFSQRTITKDTTAPTIVISSPTAGSTVNATQSAALAISGTVSDANSSMLVTISDGVNPPVVATATATGNSWTVNANVSGLNNGPLTVAVQATDIAGNTGFQNTSIVKDALAPVITINSPIAGDDIANATESSAVVISGTVTDNSAPLNGRTVTVTISSGSTTLPALTATTNASGDYSVTANLSTLPAAASVTIVASVTDLAGNPAQATKTITRDASPPVVTISTVAADNVINATELNATGASALAISGTTEPNLPVQLQFSNASGNIGASFSGTANSSGAYTVSVPASVKSALTQGALTLTASSTDLAGNPGSATRSVILDSIRPEIRDIQLVPTITSPVSSLEAQSFQITGTVSDASPAPSLVGRTVTITLRDVNDTAPTTAAPTGATPDVTLTGVVSAVGASLVFTTTATNISALNNGQINVLSAVITDEAGNASTNYTANSFNFQLDKVAPPAPVIINANGSLSNNALTTDNTPTLNFTLANNGTGADASLQWNQNGTGSVQIFEGSTLIGTVTPASLGSFTTAALLDGSRVFTAKAIDAAGNESGVSAAFTLVIDTQPPSINIGSIAGDDKVNAAEAGAVVISGVTEPNRPVTISIPGVASQTVTSSSTGSYSGTFDVTGISDNTTTAGITVTASTTDAAGNAASATRVFRKDTGVPTPVITTPIMIDNRVNNAEKAVVAVAGTGAEPSIGSTNSFVIVTFTGFAIEDQNEPKTVIRRIVSTVIADGTGGFALSGTTLANLSSLADGPITVTATSFDDFGNAGSDTFTITKDTVAPNLQIVSPPNNGFINAANSPTFTFKVSGNEGAISYTLTQGTNTVSGTATPSTATTTLGDVSVTIPGSFSDAGGPVTLTVTNSDAAGNPVSVTHTLTLDRVAPAIVLSTPATGSFVNGAVIVSGSGAHPNSTVQITINDSGTGSGDTAAVTASAVADASGNYSTTVSVSTLLDSLLTVSVSNSDPAGNVGSASNTVTLDRVVPQIAITVPVSGDNRINASEAVSVIVSGTNAVPNGQVTVTFADQSSATADVVRTVTADAAGNWTLASDTAGLTGLVSTNSLVIIATTTDEAGNTSQAQHTVVLDLIAPVLVINSPIAGNDYINASERGAVVVSGTSSDTASVTITLTGGGQTRTATVPVNSGVFTSTFNLNNTNTAPAASNLFPDGNVVISVTSTDAAGNVSTTTKTVVIDTTAPNTPAVPTVTSDIGPNAGALADGASTQDNSLVISGNIPASGGTASPTAPIVLVQILNGTSVLGTATIGTGDGPGGNNIPTGTYSYNFNPAADGTFNLRVRVTDEAGNVSAISTNNAKDITVDTQAPSMNLMDTISGDDLVNAVEAAAGVVVTGQTDPNLAVSITVFDSTTPVPNSIAKTATSDSTGAFSFTLTAVDFSALNDGTLTVFAAATDLAGNTGIDTELFTLDRVAPALTITSPAAASAINSSQANGLIVSGTREANRSVVVTITGTSGTPVTVTVPAGTGTSYATSPMNISALPDGALTITAVSTDPAGNVTTVTREVTKDTQIGSPTINTPIAGNGIVSPSEQAAVSVTGTAEPNRPVVVTFTNGSSSVSAAGAANASGAFTLNSPADLTALPDGTVTVTVTTTDAAGNVATASTTIRKDTTAPVVTTNLLTAMHSGTTTITSSSLNATDTPFSASDIVYTVVTNPSVGFIALASASTVPINSFTQQQLASGQVIYRSLGTSSVFSDSVVFNVADVAGNASTATLNINLIMVDLPNVADVSINNDSAQRSKLKVLTIDFDQVVQGFSAAGAVKVQKRLDSAGGGVQGDVSGVNVVGSTVGTGPSAFTRLTITFTPSTTPATTFVDQVGSLIDGNYQVVLDASLITSLAGGFNLDGNNDNAPGGNYIYGDEAADGFYRMFGDIDGASSLGVASVGTLDAVEFLDTYLTPPNYDALFDYDEDGSVGTLDAVEFLDRYLLSRNLNGFNP